MKKIIASLITLLIDMVDEQTAKDMLDKLIDVAEDAIKNSKTKWDDITVLPVLKKIRDIVDIPDNDNGI